MHKTRWIVRASAVTPSTFGSRQSCGLLGAQDAAWFFDVGSGADPSPVPNRTWAWTPRDAWRSARAVLAKKGLAHSGNAGQKGIVLHSRDMWRIWKGMYIMGTSQKTVCRRYIPKDGFKKRTCVYMCTVRYGPRIVGSYKWWSSLGFRGVQGCIVKPYQLAPLHARLHPFVEAGRLGVANGRWDQASLEFVNGKIRENPRKNPQVVSSPLFFPWFDGLSLGSLRTNPAGCQVLLRNSARKWLKRRATTHHAVFIRGSLARRESGVKSDSCGSCHSRTGLNAQNASKCWFFWYGAVDFVGLIS